MVVQSLAVRGFEGGKLMQTTNYCSTTLFLIKCISSDIFYVDLGCQPICSNSLQRGVSSDKHPKGG
jgi:hypothetical protein